MYHRVQLFLMLLLAGNSFAQSYDTLASLQQVRAQLKSNNNIQQILADSQWMFLHPNTAFRELIKEFANTSELTIINSREPGKKITVLAAVKDKNGKSIPNATVYVYQTDNRGFYAFDTTHVFGNEGDRRHARLFGYLKTDQHGNFLLHTIHPHGYPKSLLPSHIHCEIESATQNALITELLFDEDTRLTADQRVRSQQEGFIISKEKDGIYSYTLFIK